MRRLAANLLALLLPALVLGSAVSAEAQSRRYYELVRRFSQPHIYSEALVLPGRDSTAHVGVTFRLPHPLLVFHQTGSGGGSRAFQASVQVTVEVQRDGEHVAERMWRRAYTVSTYESTRDEGADLEGGVWMDLPPGTYRYRIEVVDRNSDQTARSRARTLTVPRASASRIGPVVAARTVSGGGDRVRVEPANLSGDVAYGQPAFAVVTVWGDSLENVGDLIYEIVRTPGTGRVRGERERPDEGGLFDFGDDPRGRVGGQGAGIFRPPLRSVPVAGELDPQPVRTDTVPAAELIRVARAAEEDSSSAAFALERAVSAGRATALAAVIDLEGARLENGTYRLRARLRGEGVSAAADTTRFATYWRNMPYSLYDLDVAIEHLSFIAPEDTLDALREGSQAAKRRSFQAFWHHRDPDPKTPYNPLMAEYYRRVDHAADAFRTGLSPTPNGLETDRGRIYVVHGAPAERDRSVPERGVVRETWTYEDGRTFVFEASSSLDSFELVTQPG